MTKTELFLREKWNKTHYPYYGLIETKFIIGDSFDRDIEKLKEKQMIEPRLVLNGWLIKLINLEKWK